MAVDDKDRLWMVETGSQPNRLVGFDPKTEKFFGITPIPSGGGTVRHMMFDKQSGQIWFGTDNNTIGRAEVTAASITAGILRRQRHPDASVTDPRTLRMTVAVSSGAFNLRAPSCTVSASGSSSPAIPRSLNRRADTSTLPSSDPIASL